MHRWWKFGFHDVFMTLIYFSVTFIKIYVFSSDPISPIMKNKSKLVLISLPYCISSRDLIPKWSMVKLRKRKNSLKNRISPDYSEIGSQWASALQRLWWLFSRGIYTPGSRVPQTKLREKNKPGSICRKLHVMENMPS